MSTDPTPEIPTLDPDVDETITVKIGEHDYEIDPSARDDFELLDDLSEMSRTGDSVRMPSIMRRLLGRQQAREALERLRDPDTGRITVDAGSEFVLALLDGLNPN